MSRQKVLDWAKDNNNNSNNITSTCWVYANMYLKSSQLIVTLGRALMGVQKRNFWGARIFCTDMRDGYKC